VSCGNASGRARRLLPAILGLLSLLGWMRASCAADIEVLAQGRGYTEGTIFVGGVLYFVDFSNSDVLRVMANRVERRIAALAISEIRRERWCGRKYLKLSAEIGDGVRVETPLRFAPRRHH
jgi:hypothetical protein